MGYKLTGDMGHASNWADALGKCVINGIETAIFEFGGECSFYGDRALRAVRDLAQDGLYMALAPCRGRNEGA